MNILIINTGDEQLDEAYKRMQVHISSFDNVEEFESYFNTITKDANKETVFKWLLKVLFWEFKYGRETLNKTHDFDILLDNLAPEAKQKVETWLKNELIRVGATNE